VVANDSLTSIEKWHVQVMSAIAKSVADTPLILKGGTALLLCYGLDRFSEDCVPRVTKEFCYRNINYKIN
jgi:hypothetical protein